MNRRNFFRSGARLMAYHVPTLPMTGQDLNTALHAARDTQLFSFAALSDLVQNGQLDVGDRCSTPQGYYTIVSAAGLTANAVTVLDLADSTKQAVLQNDVVLADVDAVLADTRTNTYLQAGDKITTLQGFCYIVADPDADNAHLQTAGGVKLYVRCPFRPEAFGDTSGTNAAGPLNACFAAAKAAGEHVVDLRGMTYWIDEKVTIDSLTVRNVQLHFTSHAARVVMTGTNPGLERFHVIHDDGTPNDFTGVPYAHRAVILLHECEGARLLDGDIGDNYTTGLNRRYGVMCVSWASRTTIRDVHFDIPWGILFDDIEGDLGSNPRRSVDGVDYTGTAINSQGGGLYISGCTYKCDPVTGTGSATARPYSGDFIEINCPAHRFNDVRVLDCSAFGTVESSSVGLGIAFADIDNVVVKNCYVSNCQSKAGAFHFEWCVDATFEGCHAINSAVGFSIAMGTNMILRDNVCRDCWEFGIKSQNSAGLQTFGMNISGNTFIGLKSANGITAQSDLLVGNATRVEIVNNRFMGLGTGGIPHMNFTRYDDVSGTDVLIQGNFFYSDDTYESPSALAAFSPDWTRIISRDNQAPTLNGHLQSFMYAIANRGISYEVSKGPAASPSDVNGMIARMAGSPQGYLAGKTGNTVDDVTNGVRYRWDDTASNWSLPGSSWSNPLDIGGARIFTTPTNGALRITTGTPTSAGSGRPLMRLHVREGALPGATDAGSYGDATLDRTTSTLAVYTGNGTTHSWASVELTPIV